MGVTVNATLCYGFRLKSRFDGFEEEENISIPWLRKKQVQADDEGGDDQMMFEDFLAQLNGLKPPDDEFDENRYKSEPEYEKAWNDYWRKKHGLEKEFDVTLELHCHPEQSMNILAIKSSVQTASWGEPFELGQAIVAHPEWREKLRAFCERADIPFEEPQFILCSYSDHS